MKYLIMFLMLGLVSASYAVPKNADPETKNASVVVTADASVVFGTIQSINISKNQITVRVLIPLSNRLFTLSNEQMSGLKVGLKVKVKTQGDKVSIRVIK
jgi:hypothetical protein